MKSIRAYLGPLFAPRPPDARIRGDISGGITAALMGVSGSMAYGMIAFAPLGPKYLVTGIVAGLIGLALANIGAAILGSNPIMITSPEALSAVMMASALTAILKRLGGTSPQTMALAMTILFFIVFASGLLQTLLGALKLGGIAKYIPYPVVAGLLNGVSLLLMKSQLRPLLGLPREVALTNVAGVTSKAQLLTLLVGVATVVIILCGKKVIKKVQPLFMGLALGTALYYLFHFLGLESSLGGVVGEVPNAIPKPEYAPKFWDLITSARLVKDGLALAPLLAALTFAISLKTMVVSVATDNLSQTRSDTNRELIGQGVGNMLSGLFGGLVGTGNQARSNANYQAGGRTALSKLVSGLAILAVVLCLGPVIALLPKVVLAAVLVAVAVKMVDSWSLGLFRHFSSASEGRRAIIADIAIVAAVMACMVAFGIFQSIAVGILISLGTFIYRMTTRTVRRDYTASQVRSSVDRCETETHLLEEHGNKVRVYELEGAIFFGTADKLAALLDAEALEDVDCVILDFRRVSDIDSTGTNILVQLKRKFDRLGKHLVISGIDLSKSYNQYLAISGTREAIGGDVLFADIDDALAWAEDHLLDALIAPDRYEKELELDEVEMLSQFSPEEVDTLRACLKNVTYANDAVIFAQDDPGDSIMIVLRGRADIYVNYRDSEKRSRLATLRPGTVLGEIAVLDEKPRSATAVAKGEVTNAVLPVARLKELQAKHPSVAAKFLIGVGRELAKRIRTMDALITELRT